ncbi:hypothetical protein ANANG_G00129380 [Anguilla anguilla]|uniref:UBX domain-containing protein n=1 Tax=Anguilla anguilla TaxID=7936 RepID=A0A9D3S066_ANGAN|nr:hypothetical protein ANANG_G00129380 [Anguilla anguilla]
MAALGDASAPGLNGLIQQFTAITGATESVGKHMLEACDNNLEMAVTMFLDGGGIAEEPSTSSSSAGASSSRLPLPEDEVRAPIPQKQDILVEPEPLFGVPKRRRPARSIFDGFRDFQTETSKWGQMFFPGFRGYLVRKLPGPSVSQLTPDPTEVRGGGVGAVLTLPVVWAVRQEQELRNGSAVDKKLSTLADLFRPPIELMHKGSFETAKDCGQLENKWLMINIQNVQDFSCQCLNRDVWSNNAVRTIIREHFIFWQVYHDSEEGQRYIQFYKLNKFPYISILDPRTGQKMVEWNQLDVASFLEQVSGFLSEHGQLDGLSSRPPPAKRALGGRFRFVKYGVGESLIDASEDSQLEAAIRASLQETHYESNPDHAESRSEDDSEAEPFSDSEGLISVDGRSPHKESSHRKEENKKNHLEPPESSPATTPEPFAGSRAQNSGPAPAETGADEPAHLDQPDDNGPKARLMLRYPDGQREQITMSTQAKLMALVKHVQSKGYPNERFELVTNFPRRKLSHLDYDITLQEAGLCPQETVFVQERN